MNGHSPLRQWLARAAAALLLCAAPLLAAAQTVTYFHNDAAGTPLLATDATGAVVWKESYQPYGGKLNNQAAALGNRIGFAGKPYDNVSGLAYAGARYYDPVLGRFMGIDPAAVEPGSVHGFNRYAYANNNPYKYVDPDGRSPLDVAFLIYDIGKLGVAIYSGVGVGAAAADVALSVVGVASPVPGVGQALKGAKAVHAVEQGVGAGKAAGQAAEAAKGIKPNVGVAPKHGGTAHNDAIDQRVRALQSDTSVSNVRKNQQQVGVNGNRVGTNRPDLQYDQGGCHKCVEFDTVPRNSTKHGDVIRANDPKAKIELNQL